MTARVGNVKFTQKAIKPLLAEKKEEVKAAAKPAAKNEEDGEEGEEKKGKNPLDLLPPSPWVFPDFKGFFVNIGKGETAGMTKSKEGMERFWKEFDNEGYSIWFLQYERYDDSENVKDYMSKNFLDMFIQRCQDKIRPYTYANNIVAHVGSQDKGFFEIQGVWVFRGKALPAEFLEHD